MDKQIITFSANEQNLVRIGGEYHYSSNKVSYIGAHFDLGANWDGFDSVRAVWFTDRINGISTVLDGEGNCTVPTEVLKKKDRVFVNLVGSIVSNGELTDRLTTYPAVALVVDSKAKVDSTETAPVTPSQFEQFVSIVQDAVANIKDIVSTTLNADYTLTFVYSDGTSYTTPSIRGERGPQGADGADGTDGNGIASAVLNSNYTLTLTFTDGTSYTTPSIRGAQGPKGDPGDVSQAQLDAAVSDLKSDIDQVFLDTPIQDFWENGGIDSYDGTNSINNTRLRTNHYIDPDAFDAVYAEGNYEFVPFAYDKKLNYVGVLTTSGTITPSSAVKWVKSFKVSDYPNYCFKFVVKNTLTPTSSIAVTESNNIKFRMGEALLASDFNNSIDSVSWISNTGIIYDEGRIVSSSVVKTSEYIPLGAKPNLILVKLPIYASSTTFGLCFFDRFTNFISGVNLNYSGSGYGSEYRRIEVPQNAEYFRTVWFNDEATYGSWSGERVFDAPYRPYYYVPASDSSEKDKEIADFVCLGTNDESIIASALRTATYREVNEIRFARGTYHIDSFPYVDDSGIHIALPLGRTANGNRETLIKLVGEGYGTFREVGTANKLYSGVQFVVSDTCYNSLDSNTQYAIFGCSTYQGFRSYPGTKCDIEHIGIVLPDNQKKIICIDGWFMSALSFDDIHLMAVASDGDAGTGAISPEDLNVGVDGCIGVRGLQGSCYGMNNIWKNAFAWGFETGFQVAGEHIVAMDLGTRFCKYGYKFGSLSRSYAGNFAHPNTLINCCDELNFNLPLFAYNSHYAEYKGKQSLSIIDYNLEWQPEYSALGGELATELSVGEWYGSLCFSNVGEYGSGLNDVDTQFWANGHGANVKTINSAHSTSGTTAERNSYTPQYMQQYFDTTLGKLLIYNGTSWVEV